MSHVHVHVESLHASVNKNVTDPCQGDPCHRSENSWRAGGLSAGDGLSVHRDGLSMSCRKHLRPSLAPCSHTVIAARTPPKMRAVATKPAPCKSTHASTHWIAIRDCRLGSKQQALRQWQQILRITDLFLYHALRACPALCSDAREARGFDRVRVQSGGGGVLGRAPLMVEHCKW